MADNYQSEEKSVKKRKDDEDHSQNLNLAILARRPPSKLQRPVKKSAICGTMHEKTTKTPNIGAYSSKNSLSSNVPEHNGEVSIWDSNAHFPPLVQSATESQPQPILNLNCNNHFNTQPEHVAPTLNLFSNLNASLIQANISSSQQYSQLAPQFLLNLPTRQHESFVSTDASPREGIQKDSVPVPIRKRIGVQSEAQSNVNVKQWIDSNSSQLNGKQDFIRMRSQSDVLVSKVKSFFNLVEPIIRNQRYSPCLTKIDLLISRTKNDIMKQHNVQPDINSQGIPWVIKDMIFVLTRLVNAWENSHRYANMSGGLEMIASRMPPEFDTVYHKWSKTTYEFIESIGFSMMGLSKLVEKQQQSNRSNRETIFNTGKISGSNIMNGGLSVSNNEEVLGNGVDDSSAQNEMVVTLSEPEEGGATGSTGMVTYKRFRTGLYNTLTSKPFAFGANVPRNQNKNLTIEAALPRMIDYIIKVPATEYFFCKDNMNGHFPEFNTFVPGFIDFNQIIVNVAEKRYEYRSSLITDLLTIVKNGEHYLRKAAQLEIHHSSHYKLKKFLTEFEDAINDSMSY